MAVMVHVYQKRCGPSYGLLKLRSRREGWSKNRTAVAFGEHEVNCDTPLQMKSSPQADEAISRDRQMMQRVSVAILETQYDIDIYTI